MRVGNNVNSVINNTQDSIQNANRVEQQQAATVETFQNETGRSGASASMRRAESGIGSSLTASRLRANDTPSLDRMMQGVASRMQRTNPGVGRDGLTATGTATPNAPIRDNQTTVSKININDDLSVTGVKVNVDIAHTYRGDLVVKLRSPEGKEVTLHNRTGGSADNLVFEANPADFNGMNSKGEWSLIVEDKAAQDEGTLKSWSLAVTGNPKTPPPPAGDIVKSVQPNTPIRDNQRIESKINIAETGNVDTLSVNVDIAHTYRGDLRVKLVSPSGKEVTLHDRTGGSADNLTFEVSRSEFANEPINGDWKLVVEDMAAQDEGTLKSWGLKIKKKDGNTPPPPPPSGQTSLQVVGDAAFRQRVAADLAKFAPGTTVDAQGYVHRATTEQAGHEQGYRLINNLLNNPNKVTIQYVANNAYTQSGAGATGTPQNPGAGSTATVAYDPNLNISLPTLQPDGTIRDEGIASEVVLAHELIHATHAQRGTIDRSLRDHYFTDGSTQYKENWRFEEFRTTGFSGFRQGDEPTENSIRSELGFRARATYLDRSSWTRVSGVSNLSEANRASAAGTTDQVVGDPWVPQPADSPDGQFIICNCFGCFGINNNDVQASSRL